MKKSLPSRIRRPENLRNVFPGLLPYENSGFSCVPDPDISLSGSTRRWPALRSLAGLSEDAAAGLASLRVLYHVLLRATRSCLVGVASSIRWCLVLWGDSVHP